MFTHAPQTKLERRAVKRKCIVELFQASVVASLNPFTTCVTDVLSCQNYTLTGKWQQSLKAWIQLLVTKPQAWAQLWVGRVTGRERWAVGVFQQPASAEETLDLCGRRQQTPGSYWERLFKNLLRERERWLALSGASVQAFLPCLQEEWYGPRCLGELTLLSGIDLISRAHCCQGLWLLQRAQSGRSCLLFFALSAHVWILEDKEKVFAPRYFLFPSTSCLCFHFFLCILFHLLWFGSLTSGIRPGSGESVWDNGRFPSCRWHVKVERQWLIVPKDQL